MDDRTRAFIAQLNAEAYYAKAFTSRVREATVRYQNRASYWSALSRQILGVE